MKRHGQISSIDSCDGSEYIFHDPIDPNIRFLYRPRSVSLLVAMMAFFLYAALFWTEESTTSNVLRGILMAGSVFVFFGITQLKDGPFIRPHPVFWRVIQSISLIYLLLLVFIFFQNKNDARNLLTFIDSSLGKVLPEKSYAEDCRFTWSAIYPQLDIFIAAHVLGWYAKSLILRDNWLCWILSIMFEIMEYSLQHQLPNFAECWWDHWILDVLLCNWLGIWLGMKTCKYLSMRTYNWRSIRDIPDIKGKVRRTMAQFTPYSWISFDWAATKTLKGYLVVILVVTLFLMSELNAFYLKYILWIPPAHPINIFRLFLHAFFGAVAVRETYQYFTDIRCNKLGAQAWISIAIIVIETLICVKFRHGEFPHPAPKAVILFWKYFIACLCIFPLWQFLIRPKIRKLFKRKTQ